MEIPLHPMPSGLEEWMNEIALAYRDALEAIPFGELVGQTVTEKDLFHFSPLVYLKFRGLEESESHLNRAKETAFSSYVASEEISGDLFGVPQMAFAFCYVAGHLGLGLLDEEESSRIIDHVERNVKLLVEMTANKKRPSPFWV
jgi:hypothetical protein